MTSELEDIILTIDTREQNQRRIKAVEDWFSGHGAVVEHSALKHCDYRLIGEFRGISVNLGVEAKGWDNFLSDDIAEMEEKLLLATAEYDHVGFFVETQNYSFVPDENNKHGKLNYTIPRLNRDLPAKTLAAFEGLLHTISKHPRIYVTQLRSEAQFPYSLYDLLVYLQKPHTLTVKPEGYVPSLQNVYMQIPQIGIERAKKLIQHYPNLFWLCSAAEPSLVEVVGQSIGTILYQFLHNSELLTPEWKAGHHLDGTFAPIPTKDNHPDGEVCPVAVPKRCGEVNAYKCIGNTCVYHPNNLKNFKQDNEGRLAFDAPAKNPVNSESVAIMAAIEGYLSGFKEGRTANEICNHFNILSGDSDKEQLLKHIKQLAWEGRITSEGMLFKIISSHTEAAILSNTTITPSASGDIPGVPPIVSANDSGDTSYLDEKTEYREVKPNKLDLKKPKMSCLHDMAEFFADGKPHSLSEFIDTHSWTPDTVFRHAMNATCDSEASKVIGLLKKITEQDGRVITFQRIQ